MTAKLVITRGLPASGKTTFAKNLVDEGFTRINRDDLRAMMFGGWTGNNDDEELVTAIQQFAVGDALSSGRMVVVDDTNLRQRFVRRFAELAAKNDAEFTVIDMTDVPLDTCIDRDRFRTKSVGEKVIRDMHRKFLVGRDFPLPVPELTEAATSQPYVRDPYLPPAVMVDIDGTVALHGDRNPYDTSRYHEDEPNWSVIEAVRALEETRFNIVFCSGRDEAFREVTEAWLELYFYFPFELHMRPQGDKRRDDVVKLELFDKCIRGQYNVMGVFDDRNRVVDAWRSIGLTVFQVAEGDF